MNEVVIIAIVVLAAGLASLAGLGLLRRLVPPQRLAEHSEVTEALYGILGAMYSVLLAFVVIAAWDDYREAHAAVVNEATTVRNLARITSGWPAADRAPVEAALIAYARQVVEVEWPAMAQGDLGPATSPVTVNQLWQALDRAEEAEATESASYAAAMTQFDALGQARDQRGLLAQERLPLSMRLILFIGAAVTIAFGCVLVIDASRLQALMGASLAALIALLLLLQFQLARPFHGVVAIAPTAMELVLVEIDAGTGLPGTTS
jgi:hypothetical protein